MSTIFLPPIKVAKKLILAFAEKLVPERILGAMNIVLLPCCDFSIESIDFTCTDTDIATLVFTLSKPIFFQGVTVYSVRSSVDYEITNTGVIPNGSSTITLEDVGITPGEVTYTVILFFLSSTEYQKGAFESAMLTVTNPSCP